MRRESLVAYDGDLVRPLGLVVLFASYAEAELDELMEILMWPARYTDRERRRTVGQKLNRAVEYARQWENVHLSTLVDSLESGKKLFEQRNELVHGRLFSDNRLESNQKAVPTRTITVGEINSLVEALQSWKELIWNMRCRYVLPVHEKRKNAGRRT